MPRSRRRTRSSPASTSCDSTLNPFPSLMLLHVFITNQKCFARRRRSWRTTRRRSLPPATTVVTQRKSSGIFSLVRRQTYVLSPQIASGVSLLTRYDRDDSLWVQ